MVRGFSLLITQGLQAPIFLVFVYKLVLENSRRTFFSFYMLSMSTGLSVEYAHCKEMGG